MDNNIKVSISGDKKYKLLNKLISDEIECKNIVEKDDMLSFETYYTNKKLIIQLAEEYKCSITINSHSLKRIIAKRKLLMHLGLIAGIALSIAFCYILSGMVLRIKIENSNPQTREDITSVLNENGLQIGSFKSEFDFIKLERELKKKVPGISWAGISAQGSTIVIDTIDNIPIPESDNRRMPCNVIALYDCVIEKTEVFCGRLNVSVGSGARAGDIIISGEEKKLIKTGKDDKETEVTNYQRASGNVYGSFEKTAEFYFPYEETINTPTGKKVILSYLNIFDTEIPLFINDLKGNYTYTAKRTPLEIFGNELPIALTDVEYSEYTEAINYYTDDEIDKKAEESIESYKKSFLSEFEIKDINKDVIRTDKGVTVKVKFTLYGEVGKQVDIYLKKQ